MRTSILFAAFLVSQTFAALFVTSPTEATVCAAGAVCTVSWIEKGGPPTLATIGSITVGLYTGNAQQQTLLQAITKAPIDASTTGTIQFTPDPSVGPNDNRYFIRFQATTTKDPANPAAPYLSFSAKFTLSGMTGKFNASVESQLAGITAPGGQVSTTTSAAITSPLTVTGTKPTGTTKSTTTATQSAAAFALQAPMTALAAAMAAFGFMI